MPVDGFVLDGDSGLWVAEGYAGMGQADGSEAFVQAVIAAQDCVSDYPVELVHHARELPARFHLSHQRANLLEAVRPLIDPSWRVLEIGGGTGALTRWFADAVTHVDVIEGSLERARAIRSRTRRSDTVDIFVGDPFEVSLPGAFDLATLVGVLEGAPSGPTTTSREACLELLTKIRGSLHPDGVLLVAIDNRLGVRYWAGCADDRTSRPFDGPLGYPGHRPSAFSRTELEVLLREAGFDFLQFYHLFPDYTLPTTVIREVGELGTVAPHQWAQGFAMGRDGRRDYLMPDPLLLRSVEDAGLFWQFSNSFLVMCSASPTAHLGEDWLIKTFSNARRPELHHTVTLVDREGSLRVERTPLRHGRAAVDLGDYACVLRDGDYVAGSLLVTEAYAALVSREWFEGLTSVCRDLLDVARARFAVGGDPAGGAYDLLDGEALDLVFGHVVRDASGVLHPIDITVRAKEPVAADFVLFRGLFHLLSAGAPFFEVDLRDAITGLLRQFFPDFSNTRLSAHLEAERRLQNCLHADDPQKVHVDASGRLAVPATGGSAFLRLRRLETGLDESKAKLEGSLHESRVETARLRAELAEERSRLAAVYESTSWRVSAPIRLAGDRVVRISQGPQGRRARRQAGKLVRRFAPGLLARRQRRAAPPRVEASEDPLLLTAEAKALEYRPLISILVPVYNTPPRYLRLAVESVLAQVYEDWELCLCDDGSGSAETIAALRDLTGIDPRIHVRFLGVNSGIAAATNAALAVAQGEFVTMLDHDDELAPAALLEVAKVLNADRTVDVVYTDQDYVEADGTLAQLFHKPDWSLEMFRGVMYVGHLLVVRRSLAEDVHGFDRAFDNVQDFEFMLRISEKTERIAHVPKVLYHWRRIPGSVAFHGDEKRDIEPRQAAAVNAHLERCRIPAIARSNPAHAHRLLIAPRPRADLPLVSVIVCASGSEAHLDECVARILSVSTYPDREIVVAGGDVGDAVARRFQDRGVSLEAPGESGSAATLAGLRRARGHLLVAMAGDLLVETPDWLEHLLLDCELPGVACVAPLILSPSGSVISAGLLLDPEEVVRPAMAGWRPESDGYAGSLSCVREVVAVSGDCFAITREAYDSVGGLSPYLTSNFAQAADLSLRASSKGLKNLCTPRVSLRRSVAVDRNADALDRLLLRDAWDPVFGGRDPFWPPDHDRMQSGA